MEWGSQEKPWPISIGDLDNWEWYKRTETMTAEAFLKRLNRVDDVGAPVIVGEAFHAMVERVMRHRRKEAEDFSMHKVTGVTRDGLKIAFTFNPDVRIELLQYETVEQDCELRFDTPYGWVWLRGVIDGVRGTIVRDMKTTTATRGTQKYARKLESLQDSWQWRAYLEMMGPKYRTFEYHIISLKIDKKIEDALAAGASDLTIPCTGYMLMRCQRYANMRNDLQGVAAELAHYLRDTGWEPPAKRDMAIF